MTPQTVDETITTLQGQIDGLQDLLCRHRKTIQGQEIRIDRQAAHIIYLETQLEAMRAMVRTNGHLTSPKPRSGLVARIRRWLHR